MALTNLLTKPAVTEFSVYRLPRGEVEFTRQLQLLQSSLVKAFAIPPSFLKTSTSNGTAEPAREAKIVINAKTLVASPISLQD